MESPPDAESDQQPEEAPSEYAVDDDERGQGGDDAESPGVPGEDGQATGNPDNAG